jgi:hypothetical protein
MPSICCLFHTRTGEASLTLTLTSTSRQAAYCDLTQRHFTARPDALRRGLSSTAFSDNSKQTPNKATMTRRPYINSGATMTEDLVMDVDTPLVRAGSSSNDQSDEEPVRAELMTLDDYLDRDNQLVRAGSSPNDQSNEELDRAEPMAVSHLDGGTRHVSAGSSQTAQGEENLNGAEQMTMDHVDNDTPLVRAGSSSTIQGDEVLDHALPRLHLELFASIFGAEPVPLKDFEIPKECFQYKDQAIEILSQYFVHTYFDVKVWINFDAHEEVFFEGARSAACGKPQLPERVYQDLASASSDVVKFQQVRLEVGTPFRTLATVDLTVEHNDDRSKLRARGKMVPEHGGKRRLVDYMKFCIKRIAHIGLEDGVDGITFNDLELFASLFRRDREISPGRNEDWEEPVWEGGEWAGEEEPSRFGWHFSRNITG